VTSDLRPVEHGSESDRFFRDMVGSMRNGVIAITRDGHVAVMNDVACHALNIPVRGSNIGGHYTDVLHAAPEIVRILAAAFEAEHLPNRAELRLKSTGRVIGYTLSLIRGADGEVTGATLFFKDLTRVEQLEERERLRDRLAALGEMAAAIAHEVKNPLAGIEVMAGLLKRRLPDHPEAQAMLNDIINEAKMANCTVVEMLDYVRPVRLERGRTMLGAVLQTAVSMAESKAPRGDVRIDMQVPADLPPLQGDEYQLCQVFTNLVINAFEALDGSGSVRITATTGVMESEHPIDSGHVRADATVHLPTLVIQVTDDGPGIAADLEDRVFNAFFTTKAQGSGLGLAIVRKIIDAHDGRIDVLTAPGQGTTFTVTLPVCAEEWFQ
jgi:signal transduction histidine kinase